MKRLHEWDWFSSLVRRHIKEYTIPQYGDYPDDMTSNWSIDTCMDQIRKYAHRLGRGARGREEELRDLLKIAHYAAIIHGKLKGKGVEL